MQIDLTDSTFSTSETQTHALPQTSQIDLDGTLFQFSDGSKIMQVSKGVEKLHVKVDNDALMDKYQFVYDYAP